MKKYEAILAKIAGLKPYQKRKLEDYVSKLAVINSMDPQQLVDDEMVCRKCGEGHFVKNGRSPGGAQRYKCKHCGSTQCHDANTPLYCLKYKDKWTDFVFLMLDSDVRKTCDSIGKELEVDRKTAHAWRHKLGSSLAEVLPLEIEGEAEADEVYFPFCVKGVVGQEKFDVWHGIGHPDNQESALRKLEKEQEAESWQDIHLCLHNRDGDFDFHPIKIQKKGNVSEADLTRIFKGMGLDGKTIITDSEGSMKACMKKIEGVNHLTFKSSEMKQGQLESPNIHNNHINGLMNMLRDWLRQFNGVSSKYLSNYLKWFRFARLFSFENLRGFVENTLVDKGAYPRHRNTFETYKNYNTLQPNHIFKE